MSKLNNRRAVEVDRGIPGYPRYISFDRAMEHCRAGVAYWTRDGHLRFRSRFSEPVGRGASDVYVDQRGLMWWNGSDARGTHKPGEVRS